jgi:UDP-GlcNAc:undecaprenyl-phosphate/decaprenyl-phosphate GlcNAc-1-phosphate transferase
VNAAVGFVAVLLATVFLTPALMRHAQVWGLVALPDGRRMHAGAVPVVGGVAMGFSFIIAWLALNPSLGSAAEYAIPMAAAVALLGGVIDDRRELGATGKFAFQIVAALLLALWGEALLTHVGHLMSDSLFTLGRWSLPLTVFAIVGVMNAVNMTDGVDGLATTSVLCACLSFGLAAVLGGDGVMFAAICLIGGAATGFFVYNARLPGRGPAPVYMGDSGSLLLGLLLAWCAITLAMGERAALAPITAVWILAVPIADTVTLMVRRALRGRSPFAGDREHLHHILMALGLSTGHTVIFIALASLALGVSALAAQHAGVTQYVMFYLYIAGLTAHGVGAEVLCRRLGLRQQAR